MFNICEFTKTLALCAELLKTFQELQYRLHKGIDLPLPNQGICGNSFNLLLNQNKNDFDLYFFLHDHWYQACYHAYHGCIYQSHIILYDPPITALTEIPSELTVASAVYPVENILSASTGIKYPNWEGKALKVRKHLLNYAINRLEKAFNYV